MANNNNQSNLSSEDKISRAIIGLQKPQPFFAHLIMRMKVKKFSPEEIVALNASGRTPTAAVDPKGNMMYAEDFINTLAPEEIEGLLAHETLHVALAHLQRLGPRHQYLANIAMDVVVNMMVEKSGMKLPRGGIPVDVGMDSCKIAIDNKQHVVQKVSEKTWEEIYAELLQFLQDSQSNGGKGAIQSKGFDDHKHGDAEPMTSEEVNEWKSALADAAAYAKQRGKLPGGMDRLINDLLKPKVEWKGILRKHLRPHISPTDWSYQRPNKKSHAIGVFMPSVVRESVEVEVVIDTSGSISEKELSGFVSEILAITRASNHVRATVNFADTQIKSRIELKNNSLSEVLALKPVGGGGTCLENALDDIKRRRTSSPVAIVFTDGEDRYNRAVKDYPFEVIWVVTSNGVSKDKMREQVNYGSIIKMEV